MGLGLGRIGNPRSTKKADDEGPCGGTHGVAGAEGQGLFCEWRSVVGLGGEGWLKRIVGKIRTFSPTKSFCIGLLPKEV